MNSVLIFIFVTSFNADAKIPNLNIEYKNAYSIPSNLMRTYFESWVDYFNYLVSDDGKRISKNSDDIYTIFRATGEKVRYILWEIRHRDGMPVITDNQKRNAHKFLSKEDADALHRYYSPVTVNQYLSDRTDGIFTVLHSTSRSDTRNSSFEETIYGISSIQPRNPSLTNNRLILQVPFPKIIDSCAIDRNSDALFVRIYSPNNESETGSLTSYHYFDGKKWSEQKISMDTGSTRLKYFDESMEMVVLSRVDKSQLIIWWFTENRMKTLEAPGWINAVVYLRKDKLLCSIIHIKEIPSKTRLHEMEYVEEDQLYELDLKTHKWKPVGTYRIQGASANQKWLIVGGNSSAKPRWLVELR
jgi:hypothetical protein